MVQDLRWTDSQTLEIDDVRFLVTEDPERMYEHGSTERSFVLVKDKSILAALQQHTADMSIQRILEVGIFKGGSTVLYHKLYQPQKLVAIEHNAEPVEALRNYIEMLQLDDVVKPIYGLDQSDQVALAQLVEREFPERDIDLVVDDASHLYEQTKACFEVVFPFMRSGGLYIIEDWSWAHAPAEIFQKPDGVWHDQLALTNLIFEAVMLCGSRPDLISEIAVNGNSCYIRRGHGIIAPDDFRISKLYLTRNRLFAPTL